MNHAEAAGEDGGESPYFPPSATTHEGYYSGGSSGSGSDSYDDSDDDSDDDLLGDLDLGGGAEDELSDMPVTGFAVASNKRNADFHELFSTIPEGDYLIEGEFLHSVASYLALLWVCDTP